MELFAGFALSEVCFLLLFGRHFRSNSLTALRQRRPLRTHLRSKRRDKQEKERPRTNNEHTTHNTLQECSHHHFIAPFTSCCHLKHCSFASALGLIQAKRYAHACAGTLNAREQCWVGRNKTTSIARAARPAQRPCLRKASASRSAKMAPW